MHFCYPGTLQRFWVFSLKVCSFLPKFSLFRSVMTFSTRAPENGWVGFRIIKRKTETTITQGALSRPLISFDACQLAYLSDQTSPYKVSSSTVCFLSWHLSLKALYLKSIQYTTHYKFLKGISEAQRSGRNIAFSSSALECVVAQ